jgi:hypothetical protein
LIAIVFIDRRRPRLPRIEKPTANAASAMDDRSFLIDR